ncbi:hypothetical protein [Streptomyces sp. NPDC001719]
MKGRGAREVVASAWFRAGEWWGRHVSDRELYRFLDSERRHIAAGLPVLTEEEIEAGLQRIAEGVVLREAEGRLAPS